MVSSKREVDTISRSPSPSMSATAISKAPSALPTDMLAAVQVGSALPSFSYQTIVSSFKEADTISISPSPSMSAAKTFLESSAVDAISAAVQLGSALPSFSYQAIVLSLKEAETISRSPSPSISSTKTVLTSSTPVAIFAPTSPFQPGFAPPLFSYHIIFPLR